MISSIELYKFQDVVDCHSLTYHSKETFPAINLELKPGRVYGLHSDYGCGSWGVATCIGGRTSSNPSGKVMIDGVEVYPRDLTQYSCFISESSFKDFNTETNILTPKSCIEKALMKGFQSYTIDQIKKVFCLSDERFERPLSNISGEIWFVSMAINFALGKQIFCYPWLNEIDINRFVVAYEHGIISFLKKNGGIIIVPSSQKKVLKKYSDHILSVSAGRWKKHR